MAKITECQLLTERMSEYLEQTLAPADCRAMDRHLQTCQACRDGLDQFRAVKGVLQETYESYRLSPDFAEKTGKRLCSVSSTPLPEQLELQPVVAEVQPSWLDNFQQRMGIAPWWAISALLHVLIIALAGLVTMSIGLPSSEDAVIVITTLESRPEITSEPEKSKASLEDVLDSKHHTPPTDPMSKEASVIVVPKNILESAELGDHFETINLDRPDTQSAFGNPDAQMFYSTKGNDELEGGGGVGGLGLDDIIGMGGASSPGSGGGWGGGTGTGSGIGTGAGHGSFGNRSGGGRRLMVKRGGGSPITEGSVDRALEWLARNQEPDGRWDAAKHGASKTYDAGATGIALLAFLGAGHSEKVGKYKQNVQQGVYWLIEHMNEQGEWGPIAGKMAYVQGLATLALGEAAGMGNVKETKAAAQKAANAVEGFQRGDGGSEREAWGYHKKDINDTSVTGWQVMALKAAKVAGLQVNSAAFDGALNWINAGQNLGDLKPGDGAPSSDFVGGKMSYRGSVAEPAKGSGGIAMAAAAALCRLFIGNAKPDDVGVLGPCNMMLTNLPVNKAKDGVGGAGNYYYWYYGTFVMFQKGGEHWKTWNEALKKVLPESQRKGGPEDGSWDPSGGHADGGCRVISTALACLCMEVYYRYQKLVPDK